MPQVTERTEMTMDSGTRYDVFISYARKDGESHATRLEQVLPNTWRDKRGINPSQDFTAEIERAIRDSRQMVVCVTPDVTREDSFVRQEVAYAVYHKKPIIVARFEEVPPPLPVFNHTWLDFFKLGWDEGMNQLKRWLGRNNGTVYQPPSAPAELASDPYRAYLGDLYEAIVGYLDQTVIQLIELTGKSAPEAVASLRRPLLASFNARAGIHDDGQSIKTVSEGMAKYKERVLLLGEPGAGKTTALMSYARQKVSHRLNDPTQPLPVLLRCAEWESSPPRTLEAWLAAATGIPESDLKNLREVNPDKLFLLFDGLDELGAVRTEKMKSSDGSEVERSYDPRKRFLDLVLPALGPVMLSCRAQDYAEIHEQAKLNGAVTLQPLTDEQIREYLHDLPDLWAALETDTGLLEIARTPLLLSFFAYGFKDAPQEAQVLRDLNKARLGDKIFERYVHERYAHEERRLHDMGETPPFTLEQLYQVLGHVAMINASGGWRRRTSFRDSWREIQDNILLEHDFADGGIIDAGQAAHLIEFSIRLNLLVQVEITLRFVHLRLRDHLVRQYCLPRLFDNTLYTENYEPNPAQALASLGEGEGVEAIAGLLRSDAAPLLRECAADGLGKTGHPSAIPALSDSLQRDRKTRVRQTAVQSLGKIGGEPVIEVIQYVLQHDMKPMVRSTAARVLGQLGGARASALLIECLQQETEAKLVREAVITALGQVQGKQALGALMDCLQHDPEAKMRETAAKALGETGDRQAVPALIEALNDREKSYRWGVERICDFAAKALEKIGTPDALRAVEIWREAGRDIQGKDDE